MISLPIGEVMAIKCIYDDKAILSTVSFKKQYDFQKT